jgi:hypothetical protein
MVRQHHSGHFRLGRFDRFARSLTLPALPKPRSKSILQVAQRPAPQDHRHRDCHRAPAVGGHGSGPSAGFSPLPEPLRLAFADTVLGRPMPLPIGLLFHIVYVTAWSVACVVLFRHTLTLVNALLLGLFLWLLVLFVFFPIVGWGVLGLAVSPKLIVASFVPLLLFAVFLWVLCRIGDGGSSVASRHAAVSFDSKCVRAPTRST